MTIVIGTRTDGSPAWLSDPAGRCWQALEAQGLPDSGITDAGRTEAEQAHLYATKPKGQAARPNSSQAHHQDLPPQGAHALDLRGLSQTWMLAHHPPCWSRPLLPIEWWHWEHDATCCPNQEGREMSPDELRLLEDTRTEVHNVQVVAGEVDKRLGRLDQTMDLVAQIHAGVGTTERAVAALPTLIAAVDGAAVDPEAIAREVAAHLPGYTVTITPQEAR